MDFSYLNGVVNPGRAASDAATETAKTNRKTLGDLDQGDFLKLMMTQLQAQDPLKPTDNTQFMAQMAQMTSVAGINELKESFASFADSMKSSQWLNASGLIGQTVLVPSSEVGLVEGQPINAQVDLPNSAQKLLVSILSASGEEVQRVNLGAHPAGSVQFSWDGKRADGTPAPSGNYTLQVTAVNGSASEALTPSVQATVYSISMPSGGGTQLDLGPMGSVKLSDVKAVG